MKFFTIATHNERTLDILKESAIKHNIKLDVIADKRKFINYGIKLVWFLEYLEDIDDNELVVFLDAFDTILLTNENEFRRKFNMINNNEKDVKKKGLIFSNGKSCLIMDILLETNSGLVMGYAKKFRDVLNLICTKNKCYKHGSCDALLEEYRDMFIIEDSSELFHNHYLDGRYQSIFTTKKCKKQIDVVNKRVRINKNGKFRFPCAIHFPKKSYNEKIIRQLGYNFDSKNKIFKSSESYLIKNFFKHYSMYLYKYYILIIFLIIVYRLHRSK